MRKIPNEEGNFGRKGNNEEFVFLQDFLEFEMSPMLRRPLQGFRSKEDIQ